MNLRSDKEESVATLIDLMQDPESSPNVIERALRRRVDAGERRLAEQPRPAAGGRARVDAVEASCRADQPKSSRIIADARRRCSDPTLDPPEAEGPAERCRRRQALSTDGGATRFTPRMRTRPIGEGRCKRSPTPTPPKRAAVEKALLLGADEAPTRSRSAQAFSRSPSLSTICPRISAQDWLATDGKARIEVAPKGDQNDNETMRPLYAPRC